MESGAIRYSMEIQKFMAHFYADAQGNRGGRTCMGTKNSGLDGHLRGWGIGAKVFLSHNDIIEQDICNVDLTKGSNGCGNFKDLGRYCKNHDGELLEGKAVAEYIEEISMKKDAFFKLHGEDIEFRRMYRKNDFWGWYEHTGEVLDFCSICRMPQDDDGRCRCTCNDK